MDTFNDPKVCIIQRFSFTLILVFAVKKGVETGGAEGVGEGGEMRSGDSSDDDDDIIGPPLPPGYGAGGSGSQPERSEEGESEEDDEENNSVCKI